jgi:hypothetical protein
LAVSPIHIWYSQESRAYALCYLEAALAFWIFSKALESEHFRDWILYGFFVLAGLYTHYFFSILVLTNVTVLLSEMRTRQDWKKVALLHLGLGLAILPLLWLLKEDMALQRSFFRSPFNLPALGYTFFSFLSGYAIGPSVRELHTMPILPAIRLFLPWLIILCVPLMVFCHHLLKRQQNQTMLKRLIIATFVPVLMCGLLSRIFEVNYKVQYVLWASIPFFTLIGIGISANAHVWMTRFSIILLCSVFAIALYNRHFVPRYQNEDTKALADYIKSELSKETPIFVIANYMVRPVRYYLGDEWAIHPVPNVGHKGEGLDDALTLMNEKTAGNSDFNLVYTRAFHGDPGEWFLKALRQISYLKRQADFAGTLLYNGKIKSQK